MEEVALDKKKILALAGVVLVAIGLGWIIYYVFFRTAPEVVVPTEEVAPSGMLPTAGPAGEVTAEAGVAYAPSITALPTAASVNLAEGLKIVAVSTVIDEPTLNSTLGHDGTGLQYYSPIDGKFYAAGADGATRVLSDAAFPEVQNFSWSPNKDKVAMEFPDGNKLVYDFQKQKQYTIPKHWNELNFTSDNTQLVGKTASPDPEMRYLFAARTDGTGAQPLEQLGDNGDKVIVTPSPNNQVLAFSRTAAPVSGGMDRQGILLIGKNHENFKQLTVEGLGFEPLWSPNGERVVYSVSNAASNYQPVLWVDGGTDATVGVYKNNLNVKTWAHKCTFTSTDFIYCAVPDPNYLAAGVGFDPTLATDTHDSIYKINIKTGAQYFVAKPAGELTLSELNVSTDGKYLFFKTADTNTVSKMLLK